MIDTKHLENMAEEIQTLRKSAEKLKKMGTGIEAVSCYADRILSGIRLLEINVTDVANIVE